MHPFGCGGCRGHSVHGTRSPWRRDAEGHGSRFRAALREVHLCLPRHCGRRAHGHTSSRRAVWESVRAVRGALRTAETFSEAGVGNLCVVALVGEKAALGRSTPALPETEALRRDLRASDYLPRSVNRADGWEAGGGGSWDLPPSHSRDATLRASRAGPRRGSSEPGIPTRALRRRAGRRRSCSPRANGRRPPLTPIERPRPELDAR